MLVKTTQQQLNVTVPNEAISGRGVFRIDLGQIIEPPVLSAWKTFINPYPFYSEA